jgi:hypothetical protein
MTDNPLVQDWLDRLEQVEQRLAAEAEKAGGKTSADPNSGESWERGQVWGHIAEFVPFWSEQVGDVIDEYQGEPIAFGRSPDRSERTAGINAGLVVAIPTLWEEVRSDLVDLRSFLGALPQNWDRAVGRDDTGKESEASQIIETRIVRHLEEHATQLEAIS